MGRDEPLLAFLPSWYLWDSCSSGRRGTAAPLCLPNPDWNANMLSFFHSGSLPDLALIWFLWRVGKETTLMIMTVLRRMPCSRAFSKEKSGWVFTTHPDLWSWQQWACGEMRPWPSPLWSTCHGGLSTTIHGCLLWQKQGDPEGYGASLALCSPASGGVSLTCLMWGPYKQCWKHLISCLPRRFPPGESDSGNLVKSWVSQRNQLGWGNVDGKGWARGIWRFKLTLGPKLWSQEFMCNRAFIISSLS